MSCRWESSKRPLFVKSVWIDGYRHAILSDQDPILKRNIKSPCSPSTNDHKSGTSKSKHETDQTLTIPTVQLLVANIRRKRSGKINNRLPREKLHKSFTFDVIMRNQMGKINEKAVNPLGEDKTMYSSFSCEKVVNSDRFEQCSNSLTERVLLWLDLAGKCKNREGNQFRTRKDNKRVATAHVEVRREKSIKEHFVVEEVYNEEPQLTLVEIMNDEDDYREAVIENVEKKTEKAKEEPPQAADVVAKRKVHIFIPNLVNKTIDSEATNGSSNYLTTESTSN